MRLRYLHLRDMQPLADVAVQFGHEPVLGRRVAIRFVVGVNGSGKTRFLQALAQTFLSLERAERPPFYVTIAYDLERDSKERTIFWRHQPNEDSNNGFLEFDRILDKDEVTNWETLLSQVKENPKSFLRSGEVPRSFELPGIGTIPALLPTTILAYTSGAITQWEEIFKPQSVLTEFLSDATPDQERPWAWNLAAERRYQSEQGVKLPENITEETGAGALSSGESIYKGQSIGLFVQQEHLKFATCAVTLSQAVKDFRQITDSASEKRFIKEIDESVEKGKPMPGLRGILNYVDWLYPVTIGLRIRLEPTRISKDRTEQLAQLYRCATTVLRDPAEEPGRLLLFDLRRSLTQREAEDTSTAAALLEALGDGESKDPFTVFRTLLTWHENGLLEDVTLSLRKRNLDGLLLYDWLSDGERVFLGRMALLNLLCDQEDALVVLDEPETHFNDYWKRQIVDVIDDNLRYMPSEVVISTHSSIALTDVFDTEITLLKKNLRDNSIAVVRTPIQTFGASPSEIMTNIFEAPDTVGQRAAEFLDMVLDVATHPDQVEVIWGMNGNNAAIRDTEAFQQLWSSVRELPHHYENDMRLINMLRSVRSYTKMVTQKEQVNLVDALSALEKRLGSGFYQFEFRRRLRALKERTPNAPPHQSS